MDLDKNISRYPDKRFLDKYHASLPKRVDSFRARGYPGKKAT
jgi:hypothetical protein